MEGVGECWTHSCVRVLLTATAIKACVVYMCMETFSWRPYRQCGSTGFAALRCEGTRRGCFRGESATNHAFIPRGRNSSAPISFLGSPNYAHVVWTITIKFGTVTHPGKRHVFTVDTPATKGAQILGPLHTSTLYHTQLWNSAS